MMKKLLLTSLVLIWLSAVCSANGSYWSEYKTPILKTALNFQASYANGKVNTSRESIDVITSNAMKYYKVVKSADVASPVYPDNGYIGYIWDRNQTNFVESNPSNGSYYYRVCAIMEDMNRYCSNVVRLTIQKDTTTTTTTTTTTPTTTTTTVLSDSTKTMINGLVTAFMIKINQKFGDNISAKITFLDTLTAKIALIKTGKNAALFAYLNEKLEEQADLLRLEDLLQI